MPPASDPWPIVNCSWGSWCVDYESTPACHWMHFDLRESLEVPGGAAIAAGERPHRYGDIRE